MIVSLAGFTAYRYLAQASSAEKKKVSEVTEAASAEPDAQDICIADQLKQLMSEHQNLDTAQLAISIYDLDRHCYVYERKSHNLIIPASCLKMLTAVSALKRLGTKHEYQNRLYTRGSMESGTLYGDLLVVMDDDPLVESFLPYVQAVADKGIRRIEGNVIFDLLRRDTLRQHPTAKPWDIPYHKVPLLMKGEPRVEREFMGILAQKGISVGRNPLFSYKALQGITRQENPQQYRMALNAARDEASIIFEQTHPLTDVIAPMLIHSSNIKAECVFYHANHVLDRWGSGGAAPNHTVNTFIREELEDMDVYNYTINDGSGLSPDNRITADVLVRVMNYAWQHRDIREVLINQALATPGDAVRHGSLLGRMRQPLFRNRIFCKTGTIVTIGASSLTGYARNESGRWYAFCIVNQNSPVAEGRIFQDRICRILVSRPKQ